MNAPVLVVKPRKIRTGSPEQRLRRLVKMTRWQLAELAHVPVESVQNLEEGLPTMLEHRVRIHKVLWAYKNGKGRRSAASRRSLF